MIRKRRKLSASWWILLLPFLSACLQLQAAPVNPADAQRMVFTSVTANKPPEAVASYRVLGSQPGFHGHVIAFWMCRPAAQSPAVAISGFAVARKYTAGNQGIQTVMIGESGLAAEGALIEFMTGSYDEMGRKYPIIFGRILSPEVQAVEVVFADEQRLRWPAGTDGFLLFRQEPVEWQWLNVVGAEEEILKSYELSTSSSTISERDQSGALDCPGR